jgi:hypothetical protein
MAEFKSYALLLTEVKRLCDEKHTGTVFITTHDKHLVRFVLQDGQITALAFDASHNNHDAIEHVRRIKNGKLQFAAHIFDKASEVPLPDTETLLNSLVVSQSTSKNLNKIHSVVDKLSKLLAEYIGPFAQFSCDDYIHAHGIPENSRQFNQMMDTLLEEIDNSRQQADFKVKALNLLKIQNL